jgi:hypothetical protein
MHPKCDKTVCPTQTETGYKIPLFCYLCLLGRTGIPLEKRAACIDNCPNIENAKLGSIV